VTESEYQNELLLLQVKRIPDLRLWRRNISVVRVGDRVMRSGIAGQADLYGYWRGGQAIEIELKALKSRISPDQLSWAHFCRFWGVTYLLLRPLKTESMAETLDRWVQEIEARRPH
jgi:hypothetical protein